MQANNKQAGFSEKQVFLAVGEKGWGAGMNGTVTADRQAPLESRILSRNYIAFLVILCAAPRNFPA
ncbi:MAG: hypothetical protein RW306_18515 [Geobacteraceae bacterium]|nr:hypothetical protein [Geobacteraceae bacterium]